MADPFRSGQRLNGAMALNALQAENERLRLQIAKMEPFVTSHDRVVTDLIAIAKKAGGEVRISSLVQDRPGDAESYDRALDPATNEYVIRAVSAEETARRRLVNRAGALMIGLRLPEAEVAEMVKAATGAREGAGPDNMTAAELGALIAALEKRGEEKAAAAGKGNVIHLPPGAGGGRNGTH